MEFKEPGPLGCAKPVLEYSYTEVLVLSELHTNFWYVSCEFAAPSFAHVQYLTNIFYRYGEHLEVISEER